jgi:phosphoserine phosphatase
MHGLVCFDCDSTLSGIEGIDELARMRGPEVFAEVEAMTRAAMEGGTPLDEVFAKRLDLIRPTRVELDRLAEMYLAQVEPTARECIEELEHHGWFCAIVSGGFAHAILPLAVSLGIEHVEAVPISFDESGEYAGFDRAFPTTRRLGKNEVLRALRERMQPSKVVMVGDGASDLETQPDVDLFVGFGGFVERANVKAGASVFLTQLAGLPCLLQKV